jgi:hypothetical protein
MTEQEWLTSTDPAAMLRRITEHTDMLVSLEPLQRRVTDRQLRLFAVACCRSCWHLLTDPRSRRAVEVSERFADGEATEEERYAAWTAASPADKREPRRHLWDAMRACHIDAPGAASGNAAILDQDTDESLRTRSTLLREVIGNPFRPVTVDPTWITPLVRSLAEAAYREPSEDGLLDPDRLAVLADALQDAGCDNEELLRHLRSQERCWICEGTGFGIPTLSDTGLCANCDGFGWRPLRCGHYRGCAHLDLLRGQS